MSERLPSSVRFSRRDSSRVLLALDEAPVLAAEAGVLGLAHLVERLAEMAHDVELVEQDAACGACSRELRNGFHISITASLIWRLFWPQPGIELAMLASERSVPPNQIGRLRTRSLTTMR